MKNYRTITVTLSIILALALVWMGFLMVTGSALAMTCIPAAAICGVCAIGLAKVDERRQEARRAAAKADNTHQRAA